MRRAIGNTKKQSGKVTLSTTIINGLTPKASLPLKDTEYYQVGPAGDYVQEAAIK